MGIFHTKSSLLHFVVLLHLVYLSSAELLGCTKANLSVPMKISPCSYHNCRDFSDNSTARLLVTIEPFACGFLCTGNCDSFLFGIFIIIEMENGSFIPPQIVWSANRNNPVRINSTLELTSDGDLVLKDADETIVWSTKTGGKSVPALCLKNTGNLVLHDDNDTIVWQSFDHPTDALLPGQKFKIGQKLIPSVSQTNWTQLNLFSLSFTDETIVALVESNPAQVYHKINTSIKQPRYAILQSDGFALYSDSNDPAIVSKVRGGHEVPDDHGASAAPYFAKLSADGHFSIYQLLLNNWVKVTELLSKDECSYPTVCGNYGICSKGQCSCPTAPSSNGTAYFHLIHDKESNLGCSAMTPLSCEAPHNQNLIELTNTKYILFRDDLKNMDSESCKVACLKICSCKAAIFRSLSYSANGSCYLPNHIFSLINVDYKTTFDRSIIYLKVQNVPNPKSRGPMMESRGPMMLWSILGPLLSLLFLTLILVLLLVLKRRNASHSDEDSEEDDIDQVLGMLRRFPFEDLKALTHDFSRIIGRGGFAEVFEGSFADGTKVAVKCLNGVGDVKKSFLTEVKSIGSIHHVNLVRLLGFCADRTHRILVYEFMGNGSLEKWTHYPTIHRTGLDWRQRKKIILDVAKGIAYLHEDCAQKIIHFDIKPQNILLDEQFNAKIGDFGLSKLVNRDQSRVATAMRGTPGYMAPEWLSSIITEKVDIYSFGVVVLELVCGRRNVDHSLPEEQTHLLSLFEKKAQESQLFDLVENSNEDIQSHRAEIISMMKLAAWCLQGDYKMRPSMSMVIKALQDGIQVEENLDYNFLDAPLVVSSSSRATTPLLPSILSGPR